MYYIIVIQACPIQNEAGTNVPASSGCRKSPMDFFDSLHNASLFCPRSGPKSCRCAAQTPA
ncbi:hypothetical protein, partial [Dysosmobacter sp. HCP28S3_G4]|uniref:hypothetical protein n=1 Tax=Dysosmobacter sp. HCP28S3_G4 TaxID=3438938 RepID=UPI003F8B762A